MSLSKIFACKSSARFGKVPWGSAGACSDQTNTTNTNNSDPCVKEYLGMSPAVHFVLGKSLGFPGSFGEVFACQERKSGVSYAVKVLNLRPCMEKAVRNEISILKAAIDHPCIVKAYACYLEKRKVSIVMEKLSGGDLFDAIQQKRFTSEAHVGCVIRHIVEGLQHLHKLNIAHCDIKLANILLTDTSCTPLPKLIDFGVSQYVTCNRCLHAEVGSPSFIAPEVIEGSYDTRADMWSLGVVVFIMLYGYNPFNPRAKSAIKYRSNICKRILKGFSNETRPGYGAYFPKCIHVSENAMDFVAHLLVVDSDARFTCEQALEHPWLKQSLMNN